MTSNTKEKPHPNGNIKAENSRGQEQQNLKYDLQVKVGQEIEPNEDLTTLQKLHAILLNCINLTKKQKLEFAESERFFMKLYLKKLLDKLRNL